MLGFGLGGMEGSRCLGGNGIGRRIGWKRFAFGWILKDFEGFLGMLGECLMGLDGVLLDGRMVVMFERDEMGLKF